LAPTKYFLDGDQVGSFKPAINLRYWSLIVCLCWWWATHYCYKSSPPGCRKCHTFWSGYRPIL